MSKAALGGEELLRALAMFGHRFFLVGVDTTLSMDLVKLMFQPVSILIHNVVNFVLDRYACTMFQPLSIMFQPVSIMFQSGSIMLQLVSILTHNVNCVSHVPTGVGSYPQRHCDVGMYGKPDRVQP